MTYEKFKAWVNSYCELANVKCRFSCEDGRFFAYAGGVKFFGNNDSRKVTIRWGSGHQAQVSATQCLGAQR